MESRDLKPVICILNPDDVYNLKHNHADNSYYCITPYDALEMKRQGISLPDEPHLQEGLVLTRKPDGKGYYYRTDETDCRIINERCLAIETILSYLGGKEFRYSENSSFRSSRSLGVGVGLGGQKSGIEINNNTGVDTQKNEGNTGEKTVAALWSGEYTHEGYIRAVEIAEMNGLRSDSTIASLLEQRLPSHPNPIESHEYHVNVTADLDKSFHVLEDISADLKGKIGGHLKVDVNTSRKVDQSATVDFFVSFGPIPVEVTKNAIEAEKRVNSKSKVGKWLWFAIALVAIMAIEAVLFIIL